MNKFCNGCGARLDSSVKFCAACGAAVLPQAAPPQIVPAPKKRGLR